MSSYNRNAGENKYAGKEVSGNNEPVYYKNSSSGDDHNHCRGAVLFIDDVRISSLQQSV